jgi:TRAP-type C4-dicarboxylate transport system permease small subunit
MNRIRSIIESISIAFYVGGQCCLALMVLMVTGNVLLRMTPIGPLLGTFELTGYCGALAIAFALAHNQVKKRNIAVEFVASRMPLGVQRILDLFVCLVSTALCGVISWRCIEEAIDISRTGEVSPTLGLPFFPIVFIIGLGCTLLTFVLLTDFFRALSEVSKK